MSYEDMTLSEQIERLKVGWLAAEKETAKLRAEVERLLEENRVFRLAQKSCEDCDGPTMQEHRELRAEVERLRTGVR